jgi:hypothetical protein
MLGATARAPASAPATPRNFEGSKAPEPGTTKLNLRDAMVNQPALQQAMGGLIEALIQAAPEHYSMIHLLIEAREANGKTAIHFTHGTPVLLDEYSTLVPDSIGDASFRLMDSLLRQDAGFPGLEVTLRKTAAAKWTRIFTDSMNLPIKGPVCRGTRSACAAAASPWRLRQRLFPMGAQSESLSGDRCRSNIGGGTIQICASHLCGIGSARAAQRWPNYVGGSFSPRRCSVTCWRTRSTIVLKSYVPSRQHVRRIA